MQIGKRIFFLAILALFAFQTALVIGNYYKSATLSTPFGWQDEGYVLGPAMKVYESGWSAYRCRGDQIICYGTVHTFFDVLVLKVLPESWVKASPLLQPAGPDWFYQAKYPNVFLTLRTFRVFLSLGLLAVIGWVAARSTRSWFFGAVCALAIPGFEAFRLSRMGLKNDFSFTLYLIPFLLLANGALSASEYKRRRFIFLSAVIVGVIGLSVKFGIILPLVALIPAYIFSVYSSGQSFSTLVKDVVLAGVCALGAFLLTNPNLGVSLGEANWFSSFLAATGNMPDRAALIDEIFKVILPSLWLIPFFLVALVPALRKGTRSERIRWFYLAGVPLIWILLTWKSAFHRSAYYLPILAWLVVVMVWTPKLNRFFSVLLVCGLLFQTASSLSGEWTEWNSQADLSVVQEPWQLFKCENTSCAGNRWVVDRTLRAAVPQSVGEVNVLFFDSMTDSPQKVIEAISKKWSANEKAQVVTTCWNSPPTADSDPVEYVSPAAEVWAKVLNDYCAKTTALSAGAAMAFENGWRASTFAVLEASELKERLSLAGTPGPLKISRSSLSPRMLPGSWQGIDSWFAPVILTSDAVLEGDFILPSGVVEAILPFDSTCKGRGQVEFEVDGVRAVQSADTRAEVCSKRSMVCRLGLENWWTERVSLPALTVQVFEQKSPTHIRISVSGAERDRCRISLNTIQFKKLKEVAK